tara:strand:+ start:276 stop:581 length:306 start_codon:yes stop_codon:yes gene_type:complete
MKYKFDDSSNTEPVPIIITEGTYEGVSYQYGSIRFDEEEEHMKLVFDYDIIENPSSFSNDELESSEEFHNEIGDILVNVIGNELTENEQNFLRSENEKSND